MFSFKSLPPPSKKSSNPIRRGEPWGHTEVWVIPYICPSVSAGLYIGKFSLFSLGPFSILKVAKTNS